ncbi:beta-galactosidase [Sphingomonas morindae]|uniref:beta-galactosidase n=1 Tax=Sphingomonas morindae TaxID=1541170 RepID=A0ABY4XE94_9SPHN|nr:beta-galactosidase [Sphingomonas morindae]USI75253.1 beta-galactosidase [Sphingomonas morindae]
MGAFATAVGVLGFSAVATATPTVQLPNTVLYGVAYYDEYTPVDRVDEDARMMQAAGITVVRIAESTWGTLERQPGVFDFSHVDRMLTAMHRHGIKVIVGTPTYAVPTWLARQHPNVLQRPGTYGPRQNMDITDPDYRAACERVIVALIDHVKDHPAVIGYQIDNETKAYGLDTPRVQAAFRAEMQRTWPDLNALNKAWGLDYWSNRINRWEDFPSTSNSINASMNGAFAKFQRSLITDFLTWQSQLVRAHAKPAQFITHNFDYDFAPGYSYGLQSQADHWKAAKAVDVTGVDIYHPSQEKLTGLEIAMFGDLARSIRNGENYLVLETEAQGFPQWTPFPGQLRLQAFSHLASGANMVEYWHWASTSNAIETYWRGLLTQDYKPNPLYDEARTIGADFKRLGPKLVDLKKDNKVAIYVSNTALTAFDAFKINAEGRNITYSDVVHGFYDPLYRRNVEVDFLSPDSTVPLDRYKLIIVPALYAANDAEIARLNDYAKRGGHLLYSFKSGFTDENVKVRYASQPGAIAQAAGVTYQLFTNPNGVTLAGDPFAVGEDANKARWWMEMLTPTTAKVVARYQHPSWPAAAAMTRNDWGKGQVSYVGFMPTEAMAETMLVDEVRRAGVEVPKVRWPQIQRQGRTPDGRQLRYLLNYSAKPATVPVASAGEELLSRKKIAAGEAVTLEPWSLAIIENR